MNDRKLVLIVDKSEAYVNFQRERVLQRWGVAKADTRYVTNFLDSGGVTLFGDAPTSLLYLSDTDQVKSLNETLAKISEEEVNEVCESGIVVYTTLPRTSTKKLEDNFKKMGGTIYAPPSKGELTLPQKLVSELNLSRSVKEMLLAYVGEDYDLLLPLVESISELPKETHPRITEEDIYLRFPQPKGAIAPWTIEQPLLAGKMTEAIDVLRRVHQHSHFLVVLAILKNKFQLAYRTAVILEENPRASNDEIAKFLKLNSSGQVGFAKKHGTTYGKENLQKVVIALAKAEAKIKGASAAPSLAIMEAALIEVSTLLKKR